MDPRDPIYDTQYATNNVLVRETVLPRMEFPKIGGISSEIPQDVFVIASNHHDIQGGIPQEIHWTNDAPDSLDKYAWKWAGNSCNINRNASDLPNEFYTYQCSMYKLGYSVSSARMAMYEPIHEHLQFTIDSPPYVDTGYQYVHRCSIFGRQMITSNMYLSYRLVERLEAEILRWIENRGHTFIRNKLPKANGPCQLISNIVNEYDTTKVQMCIKPEHLYWVIETILIHLEHLRSLGLEAIKFTYLFGETKVLSLTEIFPSMDAGPVSTYVRDKPYRREILKAPIVVIYLKPLSRDGRPTYDPKILIDELCRLFPDTMQLSFGIPRFNMRVNDNVCISIGGNNETKFDNGTPHLPAEYRYILDHPEKCEYRMLSRYLTGHDILTEGCEVNNITSYEKVLPATMGSFKAAYASVNLSEYYDRVLGRLGLAPIVTGGFKIKKRTKRRRSWRKSRRTVR